MLGNIIFARRARHNESLQTFIVVGIIRQDDKGTTYKVVPAWPTAFEAKQLFVASAGSHTCTWEVLGILYAPEAVNDKITELNALFLDSAIDWTPETVSTVENTIRLLEHSLQPPLDGEFGSDFCDDDDDKANELREKLPFLGGF